MQESHKTELVLFDLDGTLIDTAPDFVLSLNKILESNGRKKLNKNIIRSHVSDGSAKLVEIGFKINENDAEFQKFRNELLNEYEKNLTNESEIFDGVDDVISYLNTNNIIFGIVTNKPYKYAKPIVNNFEILNASKVLICPDHLSHIKPDPEGILLACSKLNINPKNCVYIGDHKKDLEAGINAGAKTIGCMYGYSLSKNENYDGSMLVEKAIEIINLIN